MRSCVLNGMWDSRSGERGEHVDRARNFDSPHSICRGKIQTSDADGPSSFDDVGNDERGSFMRFIHQTDSDLSHFLWCRVFFGVAFRARDPIMFAGIRSSVGSIPQI